MNVRHSRRSLTATFTRCPADSAAPRAATSAGLRTRPGISSIQITFDPRRRRAEHAMPPGGFRLAIVNCWDLAAGRAVRRMLASAMRAA